MECELGNVENVSNMLNFLSLLFTKQTKLGLEASLFPDHKCLMMKQTFYLSFPTSSEINVLSDMGVTAILPASWTSLYFLYQVSNNTVVGY